MCRLILSGFSSIADSGTNCIDRSLFSLRFFCFLRTMPLALLLLKRTQPSPCTNCWACSLVTIWTRLQPPDSQQLHMQPGAASHRESSTEKMTIRSFVERVSSHVGSIRGDGSLLHKPALAFMARKRSPAEVRGLAAWASTEDGHSPPDRWKLYTNAAAKLAA